MDDFHVVLEVCFFYVLLVAFGAGVSHAKVHLLRVSFEETSCSEVPPADGAGVFLRSAGGTIV